MDQREWRREVARIGHLVEITIGGEVAMIGIGKGRPGWAWLSGIKIRRH